MINLGRKSAIANPEQNIHPSRPLFSQHHPARHVIVDREISIPDGVFYTDFFKFINKQLQPKSYFEIGTQKGKSASSFGCPAVCVDPQFILDEDVIGRRSETHFYQMPSDDYFSKHNLHDIFKSGPDICFLDGMHRSEYLLRDFINTERLCRNRSIIFMHDCLPSNSRMALRTHVAGDESEGSWAQAWTGDVWKLVPLLKQHRPDLRVWLLDCAPTGLVAITNLDPTSTTLDTRYNDLLDELRTLDLSTYTTRKLWENFPVLSSKSLIESPEDLTLYFDFN